jgi:hypothetical protein
VAEELRAYQAQRQAELDRFMRESGMTAFIQETDRHVAFLKGKIAILETLAKEEKEV